MEAEHLVIGFTCWFVIIVASVNSWHLYQDARKCGMKLSSVGFCGLVSSMLSQLAVPFFFPGDMVVIITLLIISLTFYIIMIVGLLFEGEGLLFGDGE